MVGDDRDAVVSENSADQFRLRIALTRRLSSRTLRAYSPISCLQMSGVHAVG